MAKLQWFNVFQNGQLIDEIPVVDDVKTSLVNHDGYPSEIVVVAD
jgi:ABC-type transporter Mla maintaining outer membrane lipid asymmetry ATPase subunit MlaF